MKKQVIIEEGKSMLFYKNKKGCYFTWKKKYEWKTFTKIKYEWKTFTKIIKVCYFTRMKKQVIIEEGKSMLFFKNKKGVILHEKKSMLFYINWNILQNKKKCYFTGMKKQVIIQEGKRILFYKKKLFYKNEKKVCYFTEM